MMLNITAVTENENRRLNQNYKKTQTCVIFLIMQKIYLKDDPD